MHGDILVDRATPADLTAVVALMRQLAAVEGNLAAFTATPELLAEGLFGSVPGLRCWVARCGGVVVGVALCATTWVGVTSRPSIRLLNLVVEERSQRCGVGSLLVAAVAEACVEFDCALDWMVRTDNVVAQDFYSRLGARRRDEWQPWQLSREALRELARAATRSASPSDPSSGPGKPLDAARNAADRSS